MNQSSNLTSIFMLLISTLFWGGGFVFVKWLQPFVNPFEGNHLRFYLAAILVLPYIFYKRVVGKNIQPYHAPAVAAILIYLMLTFQTWGLYHTSVAKAGFLTTLYVVIIPLILWFKDKRKFSGHFIFCCCLSMLGIFLLNNANFSDWNRGDTLVSLCAIFAALHIIYIEKSQAKISDAFLFNAEQCLFLAIYGLILSFLHDENLGPRILEFPSQVWVGLFGLSVLSSIIAFGFQVYAQKDVPSQAAGVLFLLEAPFAGLLAYFLIGESLQATALVGAALVLVASILVVIKNQ